ncbi:MAG: DUF748 domain-containing protein, partial [Campylobacterota bacterium]|nr:DUF748 domain-containing protein [Campylobacterota bacterium]
MNIEDIVVAKRSKTTKAKIEEKPYSLKLKHFDLNDARVEFKDYSLEKMAKNRVESIYANAYNIELRKNSWLKYNLSMRVNTKGRVKSQGRLRHTPMKQRGSFDIKNISLVELTPKELTILGDTRAENIIGYLVQEKSIDLSRINKITT